MLARTLIRNGLLCLLGALLLQGCGFQLRGSAELPPSINPVYIQSPGQGGLLRNDLTQMIEFSNIQVVDTPAAAATLLKITDYTSDRRVLSVDGNGKVAEYELHEGAYFELAAANGDSLVPAQEVTSLMTYLNSEIEVLGKQQEEATLRNDMRRDLANQIMRRLQAQL